MKRPSLDELTLTEKISQLLMVGQHTLITKKEDGRESVRSMEEIKAIMEKYQYGSLWSTGNALLKNVNMAECSESKIDTAGNRKWIKSVQEAVRLPMLVGVDCENGAGRIFSDATKMARTFQGVIDSGVDSVMVGHTAFPAADDTKLNGRYLPATLSEKIIKGILREKMGFDGVVITDGIGMGGLMTICPYEEVLIRAINAGNDILLGVKPYDHEIIYKAVLDGRIPMERIDEAAERVLKLKEKIGLFDAAAEEIDMKEQTAKTAALDKKIAEKSITLICDKNKMLPLKSAEIQNVTIVCSSHHSETEAELEVMKAAFEERGAKTRIIGDIADQETVKELSEQNDLIVYAAYLAPHRPIGMPSLYGAKMETYFNAFSYGKEKSVGVSLGYPYVHIDAMAGGDALFNIYATNPESMIAFVKVLYGELEPCTKSPVDIEPKLRYVMGNGKERAEALLKELSVEEKLYQLSCEMLYEVGEDYEEKRCPLQGNYRDAGHFIHMSQGKVVSAREVAARINRDVKLSMDAQPHRIPPLQHEEALHGAQWGVATVFPQPIGMASTFDDELVLQIADAIGKECAAVGVRQALSPNVNIVRDCRWGRTIETFGEDVLLSSNMGAAMCKGLEQNGVIATPKHYVDNYSYGGRDSHASDNSERALREVYLKPFEKCIKEGGAQSIMASYNSWDGVPCHCNKKLLTDILRKEWGFEGFVVSDYWGVEGVARAHNMTDQEWKAQAKCIQAGLDIDLPTSTYKALKTAYEEGELTDTDIDTAVLRILTAKYRIGLFDEPFVDENMAERIVRCEEHRQIALKAARESIILLKNEGILPLKKNEIKKIVVFGPGANELPFGKNYTGPFGTWTADDILSPLQYLKEYLGDQVEVIWGTEEQIEDTSRECDAAIYFTTAVEGEGMDRSDIRLPSYTEVKQKDGHALIVDKKELSVKADQEEAIRRMTAANKNSVVVLLNGAPIDMTNWISGCDAVLEAWYPGEMGAQAICEILFGDYCPCAKLPISIPKNVGQLPLFYACKPSGRGYGYNENDGKPLYPFGYGLNYTDFILSEFDCKIKNNSLEICFDIENRGEYDGAEVVQIYLSGKNCDVVRPLQELKAYKRIQLEKKEKVNVLMEVPEEAFCYYDRELRLGMHDGDYTVGIGTSCENILKKFEVSVRDGGILCYQRNLLRE